MEQIQEQWYQVDAHVQQRVDSYLAALLKISRTRIHQWIQSQRVLINDHPVKKNARLRGGERITVRILPEQERGPIQAEPMELDILHEDTDIIILNKAAGVVVHPAPGHYTGTLVHGLLWHTRQLSQSGGHDRLGIVHRLDKNTSGLLMVAKNDRTHTALTDLLKRREIRKEYRVLCWGRWDPDRKVVDLPIGRDRFHRQKMGVESRGRQALTELEPLQETGWATYLKVLLGTGRTHQIRVHLSHWGHPVVGDEVYGGRSGALKRVEPIHRPRAEKVLDLLVRQFIHAYRLSFTHPFNGKAMVFECPLPEDLRRVCDLEGIRYGM